MILDYLSNPHKGSDGFLEMMQEDQKNHVTEPWKLRERTHDGKVAALLDGPQVKERRWPLEAGKGQGHSRQNSQAQCSANTLISGILTARALR